MDQGPVKWKKGLADKIRIGRVGDLISFEKGESKWQQ